MRTEKPFGISVISANYIKDTLISGRVLVENSSVVPVRDIYFCLTLEYDELGAKTLRYQYAYVANADIEPGASKNVSFATVPPIAGSESYKLAALEIEAFTTLVGGRSRTVYVDTENNLLELLDDASI
jgi:hypothetical protein